VQQGVEGRTKTGEKILYFRPLKQPSEALRSCKTPQKGLRRKGEGNICRKRGSLVAVRIGCQTLQKKMQRSWQAREKKESEGPRGNGTKDFWGGDSEMKTKVKVIASDQKSP